MPLDLKIYFPEYSDNWTFLIFLRSLRCIAALTTVTSRLINYNTVYYSIKMFIVIIINNTFYPGMSQ